MHTRSEFKMRWRNCGALAFLLIALSSAFAIETQNHAPSSNTVIHHPTASLSIAGDLKDVKLKASIAQLVRALQHPSKPKETDRRSKLELVDKKTQQPELITKHSTNVHSKDGRKLYYGQSIVPDAITITSQPIQIHSGANKTGGKRSRSLTTSVDSEGVKTIEGIRVPDDEHDKHYTWRNARVIKGFLVPNNKAPNPHKKRQVLITDPEQYLAAAAAAQAQGATTLVDASQSGRQAGQVVYSQSHHQTQQAQLHPSQAAHAYLQRQQDIGSGSTVYQAAGQTQSQQQPVHHQYQSATTSGQTTAFAYAPQQQGQMYVLQDGNSYVQYNPVQVSQAHPQPSNQVSQSQAQFYSRSGEIPSSSATAQTPQVPSPVPQTVSDAQNQQEIQKFQQQLAQAQALQQAINSQQAQQPQKAQIRVQGAPQVQDQGPSVQQIQQLQSVQNQQGQPINFGVPQQGAEVSQQAQQVQDILAAASAASGAQYFQVQAQPQEQASQIYQLSGQHSFAERQSPVPYQTSQNGFVIQPQTYVAGPGGQAFTIPIPVPADQVQPAQRRDDPGQNQRAEYYHHHQQNAHNSQHQQHHQGDRTNIANRIMNSIHTNKKAMDRMDTTTAVVPALASTGILLGLSALAAGWYLSRANREVGIVRRTGKPASGSNRTRRDLGAIPASNYQNQQEVDQATFFQSIIQQSLEKTQQQYEDPVEPVYNNQQPEPVYNREPEPEQRPSNNRPKYSRRDRPSRPQHRNDDDYDTRISKTQYAQDKSGAMTVASSKNFAKVFIPALILGVSVISITALIFGWYVTGANREIAFLEPQSFPTTQHRRKRSLLSSTALSDGWLQRTITAIHGNPYDSMPAPTTKSLLPHPFMDRETSKTNDLEFKISNAGLTGVLAGGAVLAIIAFGLANSFSETSSRQLKTGRANPSSSFSVNNQIALKQLRSPRAIDSTNDLSEGHPDNPGFLAAILSNIDVTQNSIMNKLQDAGKWQESPCAKRIFCDVMSTQDDDTIRVMEKRMATYINMLPESLSQKLSHTFSDVVSSIYKRDCSAFTCGGHRVDSSTIHQSVSPSTQPR